MLENKFSNFRPRFCAGFVDGLIFMPVGWLCAFAFSLPENVNTVNWIISFSGLAWFLIEVITMLANNKRRALHDFIAGSVVVRVSNKSLESMVVMPVT